ncbi:MAG TPA: type II toxin-antitoxin system HicA family toxin [Gemmataceae bacterium]
MKRVDLIKAIETLGCEFVRHGGKHDWYRNTSGSGASGS